MTLWRADPPAMRHVVEAEGMALLYHRPSGATHVLLSPAPEILDALAAGPADIAAIAARLADAHQVADDGEEPLAAVIAARLEELAAVGLVSAA